VLCTIIKPRPQQVTLCKIYIFLINKYYPNCIYVIFVSIQEITQIIQYNTRYLKNDENMFKIHSEFLKHSSEFRIRGILSNIYVVLLYDFRLYKWNYRFFFYIERHERHSNQSHVITENASKSSLQRCKLRDGHLQLPCLAADPSCRFNRKTVQRAGLLSRA